MDDHLIYAMTLVLITALGAGHTLGLGHRWDQLPLVRRQALAPLTRPARGAL